MGQERLGPSYFFISLVLGPQNSLVWYVPSLRYTRGLDWCIHCGVEVTESSTNKQHHLSHYPPKESPVTNPPWSSSVGAKQARNEQLYCCSISNKRNVAINTTTNFTKLIRDILCLGDIHGPFLRFGMSSILHIHLSQHI